MLKSGLTSAFNDCLLFLMIAMVFLFNFNTDKILGISGNAWVNICILLFIAWWSINMLKVGLILWNRIYTFAFLFALLCFTSYIYSYAQSDTLDKVKTIIVVVWMSICIYQYLVTSGKIDLVLNMYSISGTLMALYIIVKSNFIVGNRFGDVVGDANLVGITLALATTIALYLFFMKHKFIYILQFCCMGYVILLTGSRTAAVLFLLSVFVLIYISAYTYHWKLQTIAIITITLGVVVCVLWWAIMTIPKLYDALGIRIISFIQISKGQHSINNERSTQNRILFAQRALEWFADSPIWGNGINSFPSYNNSFFDGRECFSHCNYTELLSGLGILGFITYYGMYIYSLFCTWKSKNKVALKYRALVYALILELLIGDIGLVVYYEKCTWILIAIIAGMVHAMNNMESEDMFYG